MKRDVQKTKEQEFSDYHSYVAKDGRWVLYGGDYQDQKAKLLARSGGRCEYINSDGERCYTPGRGIMCHIIPRAVKRDDRLCAVRDYCRFHDELTEGQSWRKPMFGDRSPVTKRRYRNGG